MKFGREPVQTGDLAYTLCPWHPDWKLDIRIVLVGNETDHNGKLNYFYLKDPDTKQYIRPPKGTDGYAVGHQSDLLKISGYDDREVTETRREKVDETA